MIKLIKTIKDPEGRETGIEMHVETEQHASELLKDKRFSRVESDSCERPVANDKPAAKNNGKKKDKEPEEVESDSCERPVANDKPAAKNNGKKKDKEPEEVESGEEPGEEAGSEGGDEA